MKDHYGFSDVQLSALQQEGIGTLELFKAAKEFQVGQTDNSPITKISIMAFIDKHGDFSERKSTLDRIAFACFENLTSKEKKEIMDYIMESEDALDEDDELMPLLED